MSLGTYFTFVRKQQKFPSALSAGQIWQAPNKYYVKVERYASDFDEELQLFPSVNPHDPIPSLGKSSEGGPVGKLSTFLSGP